MEKNSPLHYRETLLVIVLGFSVLYVILDRDWLLYTALILGITGMVSMAWNRLIHRAWFFLGEKLGFVVSRLVLGALFFAILLPVSLMARLFRKDVMQVRSRGGSTWKKRDHLYTGDDMTDMW